MLGEMLKTLLSGPEFRGKLGALLSEGADTCKILKPKSKAAALEKRNLRKRSLADDPNSHNSKRSKDSPAKNNGATNQPGIQKFLNATPKTIKPQMTDQILIDRPNRNEVITFGFHKGTAIRNLSDHHLRTLLFMPGVRSTHEEIIPLIEQEIDFRLVVHARGQREKQFKKGDAKRKGYRQNY
ncbi:hypothetical protein CC80DRAFT_543410 [Byssothecium circinans]|uniref:Uncharacterized protein n=1 Tax=Byssothecium circinans TaxID=147558 RepID=A0A6A5UA37_9PLEO|nr:hypothetical protein CC80DRAFT_543410 [Byssothecium circinans]